MTVTPNTTQGKGAVDWTKPIEAVCDNGIVSKATVSKLGVKRTVDIALLGPNWYVCQDGLVITGWRIRNAPEHPTPTQYAPELVERLVDLAKSMQQWTDTRSGCLQELGGGFFAEARSIVSDLPQEVDPDLLAARRIAADANSDFQVVARSMIDGEADSHPMIAAARAGIARGRQLERGEAA